MLFLYEHFIKKYVTIFLHRKMTFMMLGKKQRKRENLCQDLLYQEIFIMARDV